MLSSFLAVICAALILTTLAWSIQISEDKVEAEKVVLIAMRKKFVDLNLKNLVREALEQAQGASCEEKIQTAALNVQTAAAGAKEFYAKRGIEITPWSGFLDAGGQCIACLGIEEAAAVLYCNEQGEVKVSRSNYPEITGRAAIGFTVNDATTNATWRSLTTEGFE